jgi:hypothetical protein
MKAIGYSIVKLNKEMPFILLEITTGQKKSSMSRISKATQKIMIKMKLSKD